MSEEDQLELPFKPTYYGVFDERSGLEAPIGVFSSKNEAIQYCCALIESAQDGADQYSVYELECGESHDRI